MGSIEAVLFDLYGTLIVNDAHGKAWASWVDFLKTYTEEKRGRVSDLDDESLIRLFWSDGDASDNSLTIFENRIVRYLENQQVSWIKSEVSTLASELCNVWQGHLYLDTDADTVLRTVALQMQTGLVSNFDHPPHVRSLLREFAIEKYFTTIVISAEVGLKKPDPDILLFACREIGVPPEQAIYVGDSIIDYEAATGAGVTPVIIRRESQIEHEVSGRITSKYTDSDAFLRGLAESDKLTMVKSLSSVLELI